MNTTTCLRLLAPLALCVVAAACSSSSAPPPAVDAATDTPASDTPASDAPTADVPVGDAPALDVPVVVDGGPDAPSADVPADAPTDAPGDASTDAPRTTEALRIAYIAPGESRRQAIWIQRPDGTARQQLRFTGVTDPVPDQDDRVPAVSDTSVVSVHHVAWSPDGLHLAAVVSTAIDQSEVVVLDVERGGGYVASANGQYVMPAIDWSPDGRRLAFVMSTQPRAGGLELIEADLGAHTWRFVTERMSLRGLSIVLRYDTAGAAVTWSRIDREEPTNPWNSHSSLHRVNLATRAVTDVAADLVGRIDATTRDGATTFLVRTLRAGTDGSRETALLSRTIAGGAETTVLNGGEGLMGGQGPHDGALLIGSGGNAWRVMRPGAGDVRVDLPEGAERPALWAAPAR